MSRRVSAGELQLRYELKHLMLDFFDCMKSEMMQCLERKGFSWRGMKEKALKEKILQKFEEEDWTALANYCFMLQDLEKGDHSE